MVKTKFLRMCAGCWQWARAFFWRRQSLYGLALIALLVGITLQLSILPSGGAQAEIAAYKELSNFSTIVDNPLYLPYKISGYIVTAFSDSIRIVRALSIVFYGISVVVLYRVMKRWHSDKIALFSTILFATNATVLAVGRLGTPIVVLFLWSMVISLLLWLQHGSSRRVAPFLLATISAGLLYVPGAPYFFVLLIILFGRKIGSVFRAMTKPAFYVSIVAGLIATAPLVYSFVQDTELLRQWLLLPELIDWQSIPRNILRIPSAFIYRSPVDPLFNIGRLPILDVAAGGLFLIGLYTYQKNMKLERSRIMLLTALFSIIIGALGQLLIAIVIVLPFVYAVVGAGISYLLEQWYAIFPKNPFARSFGILIISVLVLASSYYQITRFLVVWPQTPETRAVYDQPRLIQ